MNWMIFLAAAPGTDENAFTAVTRQFAWEPRLFLTQVVLFVIVAAALAKFAYRPLLAMLDARKRQIEESLVNARKTREELANAHAKSQEIIVQAGQQANQIIEETRKLAEAELARRSQEAIATAQQIIEKARQANETELARMKAELRKEVGRLVVETTAKVTGKILTMEDHQRLAEETNKQLAA